MSLVTMLPVRSRSTLFPYTTLFRSGGIADIGWCVHGYWPEQTPLSDVISLPFLPLNTAEKGSEALWQLYEKFPSIQKEYGDIVPLVLYSSSPNLIITTKKPVKTLDDFKGLKIRALG